MRDKLINVLCAFDGLYPRNCGFLTGECKPCEELADYLISHGVTIADVPDNNVGKWIPTSERLPEKTGSYIVQSETGAVFTNRFYAGEILANGCCGPVKWAAKGKKKITHWMPLPKPPKEAE